MNWKSLGIALASVAGAALAFLALIGARVVTDILKGIL